MQRCRSADRKTRRPPIPHPSTKVDARFLKPRIHSTAPYGAHHAFTLIELLVIIGIVGIVSTLLFPLMHRHPYRPRQSTCPSNLKQIGLALIGYTQDYDGHLPPAAAIVHLPDGSTVAQQWGLDYSVPTPQGDVLIPGICQSFIKNAQIFFCPDSGRYTAQSTYLYNDLAALARLSEIARPDRTILAIDGDSREQNFGHTRAVSGPDATNDDSDEVVRLGRPVLHRASRLRTPGIAFAPADIGRRFVPAATVSEEALTRHTGGCNFCLADGHVKWMEASKIYFPSAGDDLATHQDPTTHPPLGPDPAGDMTYRGQTYTATFHLR